MTIVTFLSQKKFFNIGRRPSRRNDKLAIFLRLVSIGSSIRTVSAIPLILEPVLKGVSAGYGFVIVVSFLYWWRGDKCDIMNVTNVTPSMW
jgi:hypothetical protein